MCKRDSVIQYCSLFILFYYPLGFAETRLSDIDNVREYLGLSPRYDQVAGLEKIKIAIIDNSFEGYATHKDTLPDTVTLVEKYEPDFITRHHLGDPKQALGFSSRDHGRRMAEIVWGATGSHPHGPELYLL